MKSTNARVPGFGLELAASARTSATVMGRSEEDMRRRRKGGGRGKVGRRGGGRGVEGGSVRLLWGGERGGREWEDAVIVEGEGAYLFVEKREK
jgi:hypothetical protein